MLVVMLGGAVGTLLRAGLSYSIPFGLFGIPIATLIANLLGSAMIARISLIRSEMIQDNWRKFWMTGVLGGFTTMSIFNWEALQLIQQGEFLVYAVYVGLTLHGSVLVARFVLKRGRAA